MNTKLLAPLVGALLLGGSALALADNGHSHGRPQPRGWHHESWSGPDRHWHEFQRHRHYDVRPRGYLVPAPLPHRHPSAYRADGYNRDGVTIILRGRLN
jgi:hypothetical protein